MPRIMRRLSTFSKTEVEQLFATARALHKDAGITILGAPQQQSLGRALFIVPRLVGNAPQRNKVRRQLRAIFYENKLYEYGTDFAFIVRKPLLEKSFSDLQELCLRATQSLKPS